MEMLDGAEVVRVVGAPRAGPAPWPVAEGVVGTGADVGTGAKPEAGDGKSGTQGIGWQAQGWALRGLELEPWQTEAGAEGARTGVGAEAEAAAAGVVEGAEAGDVAAGAVAAAEAEDATAEYREGNLAASDCRAR